MFFPFPVQSEGKINHVKGVEYISGDNIIQSIQLQR